MPIKSTLQACILVLTATLLVACPSSGSNSSSQSSSGDNNDDNNVNNLAPVADAGADQAVDVGATVTLDASASSDSDGNITSYSWSQTAGTDVSINNPNSEITTFIVPESALDSNLSFELTIVDDDNASANDSLTVVVSDNDANATEPDTSVPVADAGADQRVNEGTTVDLDASASSAGGGSIATYQWTQIDGTEVALINATSAQTSFEAPEVSSDTNIIFRLTVTNTNGSVDNDSIIITVLNNEAPTANASAVTQAYEGATVTLDGSASSDPDGSIVTYLWQQTAGPTANIADPAAENTSFSAPAVDEDTVLTFRLRVTDDVGSQDSDEISITIAYNNPPIASAGTDTQVNENASIELDGSASSDVEDSNLTYFWQQIDSSGYSVSLSDTNISTPTFTTPEVAANTDLIFQLTVTDSLGKSSNADVTISVIYNNPPSANAGTNQQVNENQLVELDASASSDVEDSNLTYLWRQVDSSGYLVNLSEANLSQPTFITPAVAANTNLTFQLTVTDSLGKSSDANVIISITYNNPPIARVGDDQEANEGVRIQLDGSASSDIEGSSLSYLWQQIDDSGYSITLANPETAQPSFITPTVAADTNLSFQLTVTDSLGKSSDANVSIGVIYNNPPIAQVGADQEVEEGASVQLDGSTSSDVEDASLSYLWQQVDSSGYAVTLNGANSANPSFTAPAVPADTDLIFQLTVTDSLGKSSDANVSIIVIYNNPPIAQVADAREVEEGASVELDGSASSDVEDSNLAYSWQQVDSSGYVITLNGANSAKPSFTAPQVSAYTNLTFQLTVTDSLGKSSDANQSISVIYNIPPTANAGADRSVNEGANVELDGSISRDAEGGNLNYLWQQVDSSGYSVSLSDSNTSTPTFTAPQVVANTSLIFQLTVTDSLGKSSDDNVSISIVYNNPPTANAGANTQANENASVQLYGGGSSDIEDISLAYLWQQVDNSGYSVDLSDANIANPTFITPEVAANTDLIFQLTVTDSLGKSSDANVTISVIYNNPPSANAGTNQQVNESQLAQLDGSASSDSDGSIASYSWQQVDSSGYAVTLIDADSAKPSFTTPEVAANTDLVFQLTVTDSLGKSSDANSTISVIYNTPPVAQVGANQIVYEGENVQLDASSSSDSDGSIASYSWLQFDDSGYFITLTNPETAQPSFIAPEVPTETYIIFQLTVTDDLGKSSDANLIITVLNNAPPVAAVVTATTQANEGETVQLDGSASSDTEDSSLSYFWQQVDSSGYSVTLVDADTAKPSFTTPIVSANTDLIFQLTVTDSIGKSSDANATVSVIYNSPPSADAGANQSFYEGESVELDGSASSDVEDSSLTYSWQQVDDSAYSVTLANPETARPSFTTPEVFTDTELIFQLTVTDSLGKSSDANVTITVFDNAPPTASAGADQSLYESESVQLVGSASSDSDGSIASYSWQQVDSSGYSVLLSPVNSADATFIAPEVAADTELIFELTVTDNDGDQDSDTVVIAIKDNNPPSANAGADLSVNEGAIVQLNGSASSDVEDSSLSYLWQQVDSSGYTLDLSDAESATPSFTAPDPVVADTELIFQLTVSDSLGKSSDANVSITVIYNAPPIANAGNNQPVDEGALVTLDGSASSDSEDAASSLTYLWQQVDSSGYSVTLNDANSATASFTAPNPVPASTILIFQLTVTDSLGKSDDANATITVIYNSPPTANAGNDQSVNEGAIVALDGSSSSDNEDDDSSLSYLWQQVDSSGYTLDLSDAESATPSFTAPNPVAANTSLILQLTVTDSFGKSGTDSVTISVIYNAPPTANAGAAQSIYEGATVVLDGSGSSDSDGSIASYSWQQVDSSGYSITLESVNSANPGFAAPEVLSETDLILQLTVTDNLGKSSDANVTITVLNNTAPTADAGVNRDAYEGEVVSLDASRSSDNEDNIVAYFWEQTGGPTVNLVDADTISPSFIAPEISASVNDTYFRLTVTDAGNASSTDDLTVIIINNNPPTANAGADQEINEGYFVELDGSGSNDIDGHVLSYSWQQVDSSGYTIDLSNNEIVRPTFTTPGVDADTNFILQLTVTDSIGKSASDNVTITVIDTSSSAAGASIDSPAAPGTTANAGAANSQAIGTIASLRGSGSDGAESYLWQESTAYGIVVARADSAQASFQVPDGLVTGTALSFQLTTTDSLGYSSRDSTGITVAEAGSLKWHFATDAALRSSAAVVNSAPAVSPDGTVYFTSYESKLYALNIEDGSVQWSFAADGDIMTPPTIGADGSVYFASNYGDDGYLYAVSPPSDASQSGVQQKWRRSVGAVIEAQGAVAIAADGSLYLGSRDGYLYALDPEDGSVQWRYEAGKSLITASAISPGGAIHFGDDDQSIYALNPPSDASDAAELVWRYQFPTDNPAFSNPAIAADGSVYVGGSDNYIYALSADGSSKWHYQTGGAIKGSPALAADGSIYFGSSDAYIYALDADGSRKWRYQTDGAVATAPTIGADGAVYFASNDQQVYALDPDGELLWSYPLASAADFSSSALASDGTLFISTSNGLYALHTAAAGLASDSPWAKARNNNSGSSRANLAPSAKASSSESTVNPGATVTLDASASTDSDGSIIDYYWRETSGFGISIQDNNSARASFTAPTPSANTTLSIELSITDNQGTTTTTTLNINIEI